MRNELTGGLRGLLAIFLIANFVTTPGTALAVAHGETNSSGPTGNSDADVSEDEVTVDESSGTVRLSIPVELPPGPNGQQPDVSLRYSSGGGNGLAGVGWSLPMSKVECSARFGVPDYQNCDRFELDGEVLVGPTAASTSAEFRYHTFNESFARISYFPSGDVWRVTSPDGVTRTYGGSHPTTGRVKSGSGGTAKWYLVSVADVFGNVIEHEYSTGPTGSDSDVGYLRPALVRYGDGSREVHFSYAPRPDPIVDYSDGIRTRISERVSGIKVLVQGQLHHRLLFEYEQSISSNVSRLVSAQRFGNDCDPDATTLVRGPDCSALPPMEFTYHESGSLSREERWEEMGKPSETSDPAWFLSGAPSFSTGNSTAYGAENMQLGDINGDGYMDIIFDAEGRQDGENSVTALGDLDGSSRGPEVFLHNGLKGQAARWEMPTWNGGINYPNDAPGQLDLPDNSSAVWTDRLRELRFDMPSLRVKQVESISDGTLLEDLEAAGSSGLGEIGAALGTCIEAALNESPPQVEWKTDGGSVQLGKRAKYMAAPSWDSSQSRILGTDPHNPGVDPYASHRPLLPLDTPYESEIRPFPHFQIVDLNADGLADFVMSVHLSGFNLSLDDCASAEMVDEGDETWIPGATTRVVFLNTGEGWVLDEANNASDGNIADTLPVLAIVAFESSDLVYRRVFEGLPPALSESRLISPCDDAGLAGVRGGLSGIISPWYPYNFESWDFCVTSYDLTPVFQDLNGDGYPDIIVKETSDVDALFHGWRSDVAGWTPGWRVASTESVAWIQHPDATGSEPRWTREPAFDPPLPHAHVAQWQLDTHPPSNPQVNNLDRGVRFGDLNRDGLADIIADSSRPLAVVDPVSNPSFFGALLNRGAEPGAARYSAWCASSPVGTASVCASDAGPYAPPASFAPSYSTDNPGWGRSSVVSISKGQLFEITDLNGDGWSDILTTQAGTGAPRAYIQNPGDSTSVWVNRPAFAPNAYGYIFEEFCQTGNSPSGGCTTFERNVFTSGFGFIDANSDGVVDIIASNEENFANKESLVSTTGSAHTDLLASYSNGRGAKIELTYASAILQRDDALEVKAIAHAEGPLLNTDPSDDARAEVLYPPSSPAWPVVSGQASWTKQAVLASKTVSVANAAPAKTTYKYAHPRRCPDHNTELGFRLVEVTRPDQSRVESFYFQTHGRSGVLAEQTIFDEMGMPVHFSWFDWERPNPSQVTGGITLGTGALFDRAYIGRLKTRLARNEYGSFVGEDSGFETRTEYIYDDVYGYNFVSTELMTVPGRNSRIEHVPHPIDSLRHLVGRISRVTTYADQASDSRLLSDRRVTYYDRSSHYTFDQPGMVREFVASRNDPQESGWRRTYFAYTAEGNLSERRVQESDSASADGQTTTYCYDGDAFCDLGQNSHSLLVGTYDAHGQLLSHAEPHAVFATPVRESSYYADIPTTRRELDALGRVVEEWVEPEGLAPIKLAETEYVDFPTSGFAYEDRFQPYQVSRQFAAADAPATTEMVAVMNGAGDALLSITLMKPISLGAATVAAFAKESFGDPVLRTSYATEPFVCPGITLGSSSVEAQYGAVIAACASVPLAAKTSIDQKADTLGRPLRVDTPLGFELFRYAAASEVVIGSGAATPHDAILHKNANGGLRESILAAGKPVRIRDCNNATLDPQLADLSGVSCESADESILVYEPTGELRERVDPTAIENGGYNGFNVGPLSNQRLQFHYDTLGRIERIEDPDAGVSLQEYDAFDNLSQTTDARGVTITTTYDGLNRPLQISTPNEAPTNFEYKADLFQLERMLKGEVSEKLFAYDELGRVIREVRWVDTKMMRMDFELDLMGRPLTVRYPTVVNGAVDSIGYVYDGAFLVRVCDLRDDDGDCDGPNAQPIVSNVVYDGLGRIESMALPGGTRTFAYDGNSARRIRDEFASETPGQDITFAYELPGGGAGGPQPAYDALGNLLRVDAMLGTGGGSTTYQHEYAYDARNRIDSWTWNGVETDYAYDRRGNLTLRADEVQDFAAVNSAHAIQTRRIPNGPTYSYEYDAAGNLASRSSSMGGMLHYSFDDRGRLRCVGAIAGSCGELDVQYSGDGERVKEVGSGRYVYAGPNFRYRSDASGNPLEYWIEIRAGGARVAYKHVYGGALRIVSMFPNWQIDPGVGDALGVLAWIVLGSGALAFGFVVVSDRHRHHRRSNRNRNRNRHGQRRPIYVSACATLGFVAAILPVQVWAGGVIANPHGAGSEAFRWVLSDMIGSGIVELDSAGHRLSHTAYEPFGDVATSWGSSGVGSRKYYAGHDRQLDVDLVYMNARWMDPGSGTFISVDPVVREATVAQSFNGYAYTENNPVTGIDPTGMSVEWRIEWTDPETGEVTATSAWQSADSIGDITGGTAGANITVDGMDAGFVSFSQGVSSMSANGSTASSGAAPMSGGDGGASQGNRPGIQLAGRGNTGRGRRAAPRPKSSRFTPDPPKTYKAPGGALPGRPANAVQAMVDGVSSVAQKMATSGLLGAGSAANNFTEQAMALGMQAVHGDFGDQGVWIVGDVLVSSAGELGGAFLPRTVSVIAIPDNGSGLAPRTIGPGVPLGPIFVPSSSTAGPGGAPTLFRDGFLDTL